MSSITLTIPNDDHIALRAFGKALEEMALAHGAPLQLKINEEALSKALDELQQAAPRMMQELHCEGDELQGKRKEPEVDTTTQQVESLASAESLTDKLNRLFIDEGDINPTTDSTGTPWDERIHSTSKALNADGTWRLRRKPKDMDESEWAALIESVKLELTHGEEIREAMDKAEHGEAVYYTSEEAEQKMEEFKESVRQSVEPPVTPPGDDFHTDADVVTEQTVAGIPPLPVPPPTDDWQSEVTHPETGDLCSVCMKPQFSSPSGVTCENGHGGAPSYEKPVPPPVVVAPPVPEVTEWDFPRLMTFLTERHGKIDVATVNTLLAQDGMSSVQELNAHPDKIGPFVARVKAHLGE